jgi:hypothetical protein
MMAKKVKKPHWFKRMLKYPPIEFIGLIVENYHGVRRFITLLLAGIWTYMIIDMYKQLRPCFFDGELLTKESAAVFQLEFALFEKVQAAFILMLGFYFGSRMISAGASAMNGGAHKIMDLFTPDEDEDEEDEDVTPGGPAHEVGEAITPPGQLEGEDS